MRYIDDRTMLQSMSPFAVSLLFILSASDAAWKDKIGELANEGEADALVPQNLGRPQDMDSENSTHASTGESARSSLVEHEALSDSPTSSPPTIAAHELPTALSKTATATEAANVSQVGWGRAKRELHRIHRNASAGTMARRREWKCSGLCDCFDNSIYIITLDAREGHIKKMAERLGIENCFTKIRAVNKHNINFKAIKDNGFMSKVFAYLHLTSCTLDASFYSHAFRTIMQ